MTTYTISLGDVSYTKSILRSLEISTETLAGLVIKHNFSELYQKIQPRNIRAFQRRLDRTLRLAMAYTPSAPYTIVGMIALKSALPQYVARLERETHVNIAGRHEIGYWWIAEEARRQGLGTALLDLLVASLDNVSMWCTTGEEYVARLFQSRGFVTEGVTANHKYLLVKRMQTRRIDRLSELNEPYLNYDDLYPQWVTRLYDDEEEIAYPPPTNYVARSAPTTRNSYIQQGE